MGPMCAFCDAAKRLLNRNNIPYKEINVAENEKARNEMFEKTGQMGVPVIDINGTVIIGYDTGALKKALSMA